MLDQEIDEFPAEFGALRRTIANRLINVTFGISAVNAAGTRQKVPGSGVFVAPYLGLTAKHVITDILSLHSARSQQPVKELPIGVKLHQIQTLDQEEFRITPFATWDVREFIGCPYSDLVLLDVVPANQAAEALAARRWNDAMFRLRLLPPEPDKPIRAFGFPAIDWDFEDTTRRLDVTSNIVYSQGRVTEVFDDWRVEPQAPPPDILGGRVSLDRSLTDFPCFEMTAPVEEGMSGGPVFHGDDLFGVVSAGFELEEGAVMDAARSRAASLWPLLFTAGIPTGLERVSFLTLLKSALMNCADWRDAEKTSYLDEIHGRLRARRRFLSG